MPGHWAGGHNLDVGPARDQDDRPAACSTGVCGGVVQGKGAASPGSHFPYSHESLLRVPVLVLPPFLQPATRCLQSVRHHRCFHVCKVPAWPPDNLLRKSRLPPFLDLLFQNSLFMPAHDSRNHCMVYPVSSSQVVGAQCYSNIVLQV